MIRLAGVAILLGMLSGCGAGGVSGKAFSIDILGEDSNKASQKQVLERLDKASKFVPPSVVVARTGASEVTGIDLDSGKSWTATHAMDRRPSLAGALVLVQGGGEIAALDARTGTVLWKTSKPKGKLIGGGSDGKATALVVRGDAGSELWVFGVDGTVKFSQEAKLDLGAPTVSAGVAFVPWKNLYVTGFDAETGAQLTTYVTQTDTTRVVARSSGLFAGAGGLVRFDAGLGKEPSRVELPKDFPDVSRRDLYVAPEHDEKLEADASDFTAISGVPAGSGSGFEGDRVVAAYYRIVLGFSASKAELGFVYVSEHDVVAVAGTKDGSVVVDKSGKISLISAKGGVTKSFSLGKPALTAEAFADGLNVGAADGKGLSPMMREAVLLKADELSSVQVFLVRRLSSIPDEDATKTLLDLADAERTASSLRDEARKALALRKNGQAAMLDLLTRHADFLKGTVSPPVGPMARALGAMKTEAAVGPLVAQLLDPGLPARELVDTAIGLAELDVSKHVDGLQRFVHLHRGSATANLTLVTTIGHVALAIGRSGVTGREFVVAASKDPMTDSEVKSELEKTLETLKKEDETKKKDEPPTPKKKGK